MFISVILLGALPATLFIVTRLNLGNPPKEHLVIEVSSSKPARSSREDAQLAA
jgi:hypothetical protein